MKRSEVWTQSGGSGYASKPRPVLILQCDLLMGTDSMIICPLTTHDNEHIPTRVKVTPNAENGLREPSDLMTEKITAVPKQFRGHKFRGHNNKFRRHNTKLVVPLRRWDTAPSLCLRGFV